MNQPEKALYYATQGLKKFPNSRYFLWPAAEACKNMGEYFKALEYYEQLLLSVQSEEINNHYNEILLFKKIAECSFELNNYQYAEKCCMNALALEPDEEITSQIQPKLKDIKKLLHNIRKGPLELAN